jgi:hypothetical protein
MRDDDFESSTTSRHSNAVAFEHPSPTLSLLDRIYFSFVVAQA